MAEDLGFVHRWLPVDGATTTVLALHGTGGDENDMLPLVSVVAPGTNVLSPRGKVLEMGAPRFFRRLGEGVFDVDDLVARSRELADFVVAAAETYGFDATRVVALGYSNGANIASATMVLRPEILAGAALVRAMKPFDPTAVSGSTPDLAGKPVLVLSGSHDPIVPVQSTEGLVESLRAAGAEVAHRVVPSGHQLVQQDVNALAAFFGEVVGP
ncbi:MAG TPA: alpha/beta hydrolase [Actinomycetota bacterium]|jgi:phospholipase/carboxylesterase